MTLAISLLLAAGGAILIWGVETEVSGARLILVGSRRRGMLASLVLGSVSATVAARAPCRVVIVPEGARVPS